MPPKRLPFSWVDAPRIADQLDEVQNEVVLQAASMNTEQHVREIEQLFHLTCRSSGASSETALASPACALLRCIPSLQVSSRAGASSWDDNDLGSLVWDDAFDASAEEVQLWMRRACEPDGERQRASTRSARMR